MRSSRTGLIVAACGAAASLFMASGAMAQPFALETIITRRTSTGGAGTVPGLPADQLQAATDAGTTISWGAPPFGSQGLSTPPSIDNSGGVAFFGFMQNIDVNVGFPPVLTSLVTTANQRAVFYASTPSSISIVARDGSAAAASPGQGGPTPAGLPTGWTTNGSATGGTGLTNGGVGLSSSGAMFFGATVADRSGGGTSNSTNNTAFFTGTASGMYAAARNGTSAPNTGAVTGANFSQGLALIPANGFFGGSAVNPSGQVAFSAALTGGSGLTAGVNDSGLFIAKGTSTGPSISNVVRRGDSVTGVAGATFGALTSNGANTQSINASGGVAFSNFMTGPAAANASGLFYAPSGSAPQIVAQAGTAVGAALPGVNYINGTATSRAHVSLTSSFVNSNGYVGYVGKFAAGGSITAGVNDTAVMSWSGGTTRVLAQSGVTTAPGTGGNTFKDVDFNDGNNGNLRMNNNNSIFFRGTVSPGGAITAGVNDTGIWKFDATGTNAGQLIVLRGQDAPGFSGLTFNGTFAIVAWNNRDEIVFQTALSDGRSALYAYSPLLPLLTPLIFSGNTSVMGSNFAVNGFAVTASSNGDGGSQSLSDTGWFSFGANGVGTLGTNFAIVRVQIPAPGASAVLGLAGLAALRRRRAC